MKTPADVCGSDRNSLQSGLALVNRIGAVLAKVGAGEYNPLRRDRRKRSDELRTALGIHRPHMLARKSPACSIVWSY